MRRLAQAGHSLAEGDEPSLPVVTLAASLDALADCAQIAGTSIEICVRLATRSEAGDGPIVISALELAATFLASLEQTFEVAVSVYTSLCDAVADRVAFSEERVRAGEPLRSTATPAATHASAIPRMGLEGAS